MGPPSGIDFDLIENFVESRFGAATHIGFVTEQAHVMVDAQHQRENFKSDLLGIGVGLQLTPLHRVADATSYLLAPAALTVGHGLAQCAGPVIVFNGGGDEKTRSTPLAVQFEPVGHHAAQAGQAAWLAQGRLQHLGHEALAGQLQNRQLQILAAAKVSENAALGHVEALGQLADRQAFETDLRGLLISRFQDSLARLLTLAHMNFVARSFFFCKRGSRQKCSVYTLINCGWLSGRRVGSVKVDLRQGYANFQLNNHELVQLARLQASAPDQVEDRLGKYLEEDLRDAYEPAELKAALETFELAGQRDRLETHQDEVWSDLERGLYRRLGLPLHDPKPELAERCSELAAAGLQLFDRLDSDGNGRLSGTELERALASDAWEREEAAALVCLRSEQETLRKCHKDGRGITRADLESLAQRGVTQNGDRPDPKSSARLNASFTGRKLLAQSLAPRRPLSEESFDPSTLRQAKSGSCVSLATLLGESRQEVARMFTVHADNTVTINFRDGHTQRLADVSLAERLYQASAGDGERWPALLELAVGARLAELGGLRAFPDRFPRSQIAVGQRYEDAFALLSGRRPRHYDLSEVSPERGRELLQQALQNGPAVAASRWPGPDGVLRNGIVENHAYAVLAYDRESDLVTLRNPWRKAEWVGSPDGQDDGLFQMPFLEFYASYREVVGRGEPPGLLRRGYTLAVNGLRRCLGHFQHVLELVAPWER